MFSIPIQYATLVLFRQQLPGVVFRVPATYPFHPFALARLTAFAVEVATPLQRDRTLRAVLSPCRMFLQLPVTRATMTFPSSAELGSMRSPSRKIQFTFERFNVDWGPFYSCDLISVHPRAGTPRTLLPSDNVKSSTK